MPSAPARSKTADPREPAGRNSGIILNATLQGRQRWSQRRVWCLLKQTKRRNIRAGEVIAFACELLYGLGNHITRANDDIALASSFLH